MSHSNVLVEKGAQWHLFIRQETTEYKMLNKAAWNVKERGQAGIVHYHAANQECNSECELIEPEEETNE